MRLRSGVLLIAQESLQDPHFMRSVVYLLEHHAQGSMGVIINRPLDLPLGGIWETCPSAFSQQRCCASGGPVEPHHGLFMHRLSALPDAFDLGQGVFVGGDTEVLCARCAEQAASQMSDDPLLRLFLGHAGWGPGQLEAEIQQGSWQLRPGHPLIAMNPQPDEELWATLVRAGPAIPCPHPN